MPDGLPLDNQDQTNSAVSASIVDPGTCLRLAQEAYSASTNYFDSAVRKGLINDLRQFQGQHPQGSKYESDAYRARSRFFRPKTRASVRKNEAIAAEAFFSTMDVLSVKPTDDNDPMQLASAEINKHLVQYRLKHSIPWFLIATGAYQDAQVQGIVCSYQYWEYNTAKNIDRPVVKLRPLENIRFDPSADWYDPVGTSPYFIDMIPMYVKDVRARMTTIEPDGQPRWNYMSNEALLKASTSYSDVVRLQRETGKVDPKTQASKISEYAIVWIHRNIVDIDGQDWVYHTLGTQAMLDNPRPLKQAYFHGKRPYVIGFCVVETHKTYPSGPVRLVNQIQAELNDNANQRSENVKLAMNKRYFVRRNAQVDLRSLARSVAGSTTLVNDTEKDIKVVETNDVTGSAFQEQDRLNLDFDDLAGSFSQASVQANRKLNETVGGMNILTKDASTITGYQLRTFAETWMEPVLMQLVLLEQWYETDDKILAFAGEKANLYQKFGINVITNNLLMQELTVDVNVGIGAVNPHDQLQNFLQGMESLRSILADGTLVTYGIDVQEVIAEIFGKLGYRDGKRFFPQEDDPKYAALQATIEKLKSELESKQPAAIIAATVKKLEAEAANITATKVKTGVESMFSAVQAAQVIAATPQVAPVADIVMKASGYTSPVPPGIDPNLPTAGNPVSAAAPAEPMQGMPPIPPAGPNTDPNGPRNPNLGVERGIETMRPDSGA